MTMNVFTVLRSLAQQAKTTNMVETNLRAFKKELKHNKIKTSWYVLTDLYRLYIKYCEELLTTIN